MRIEGNVLNARTVEPMAGVQVRIRVGQLEFTTHSGPAGNFTWSQDASKRGEVARVTVREAGFLPWQLTRDLRADETPFRILLEPEAEPTTTGVFVIRDAEGNPVPGAEIQLGEQAGSIVSAVSDTRGEARIKMSETQLLEEGRLRINIVVKPTEQERSSLDTRITPPSPTVVWISRIIRVLVVGFLLLGSALPKLIGGPSVTEGFVAFEGTSGPRFLIGLSEVACVVLYAIPRTSVFGVGLLTGLMARSTIFLTGTGNPWFLFLIPVIVLAWIGLFLSDARRRAAVLSRKTEGT